MTNDHELTGRGSTSLVWVAGPTVRRERGTHSGSVAALLQHLDRHGFALAPRHLGVDEQGRDAPSRVSLTPRGTSSPTARIRTHLRCEIWAQSTAQAASAASADPAGSCCTMGTQPSIRRHSSPNGAA